jgi:hypothetical protein
VSSRANGTAIGDRLADARELGGQLLAGWDRDEALTESGRVRLVQIYAADAWEGEQAGRKRPADFGARTR